MQKVVLWMFVLPILWSCKDNSEIGVSSSEENNITETPITPAPVFTMEEGEQLLTLPLACVEVEYPNKLGQTIGGDEDLRPPRELHPVFYGCFDWHSAVHGYWSMVTILKKFPDIAEAPKVRSLLKTNLTQEKIASEVLYFEATLNKSYERTYGWAWLLKLAEALYQWEDPLAEDLRANIQPLTDIIVAKYLEFLPKLVYPIRVGEHTNTAFGLSFAYDYAKTIGHEELRRMIERRAKDFYANDRSCPIDWEPSGYDFLSPCLEELDLMRRVLSPTEFKNWLSGFMPELWDENFKLEVGQVRDRTDGKLVHLDGLNFSRAWVLYGLAGQYPELKHLNNIANEHMAYSYPNLVGDSYEGGHWLGSFAIYALESYSAP